MAEGGNGATSDESMKLAIAISLLRSKFIKNTKHSSNAISPSQSENLLRWKRKVHPNYSSLFSPEKSNAFLTLNLCDFILRLRKGSKRFYASNKISKKLKVQRGYCNLLL